MAKQNLKYFWLLLVVLCTTTHVAFATTVERMFTESLSDDGVSVNQLVVDGSFTNVGHDCTPDPGSGWTIYELYDNETVPVVKGSTTGIGQRARMFTYGRVPNLYVAYYNRNIPRSYDDSGMDIDELKNAYYMTYGEEADPANEPPLILEKVRYNFSWYCVNWKGDNNMYYFDIIDEAGEVVYHREDLITATLNCSRDAEVEATKIEFAWTPEKEGKYILKWYMQGESTLGNIKVEKISNVIEYYTLDLSNLDANQLPLGVSGNSDDNFRIGDGVTNYSGAPRIIGDNTTPNQGIYWSQRAGSTPGELSFGKAWVETRDEQYPAIHLKPGKYILTYKNAGWNGSTSQYNLAIKNSAGEAIFNKEGLNNTETLSWGDETSISVTSKEFKVTEEDDYYIEFTTEYGYGAHILTSLSLTKYEPISDNLANEIASGTCGKNGDNITWVLTDDGTLTLSGSGEMADYDFRSQPWSDYNKQIKKVTIGYGITTIGEAAFQGYSFASVVIPASVVRIRRSAFDWCGALANVTIPNSVTSIESSAFQYCTNLTSVTIPNSVVHIEDRAFADCSSLTSMSIPNSVTSIGYAAFQGCGSLTSVTIPNSVTTIEDATFAACGNLISVDIPNSVTNIGNDAFAGCCKLVSVNIPNSVTSIGERAFDGCESMVFMTIPKSVMSIGERAFPDNDLSDIYYTGTENEWNEIEGLIDARVPDKVKMHFSYVKIDGESGIIESGKCGDKGDNIIYELTDDGTLTLRGSGKMDGYSSIVKAPWYDKRRTIKKIIISEGITNVGSAFDECSHLTSVSIPNSVMGIESFAFSGCKSLTTVMIPNSVIRIGNYAFQNCNRLSSVSIPNSVISIGEFAFLECESLTSLTIPNTVTNIGNWAFAACPNLNDVYYSGTESEWNEIKGIDNVRIPANATIHYGEYWTVLASGTCGKNGNNITWILTDEGTLTLCGGGEMDSYKSDQVPWNEYRYEIQKLSIGEGITIIGDEAFIFCRNLTSVMIPNTVTSIGKSAFMDCESLTSVNIPTSVTCIGDWAFYGCSGLTSVSIPNSVTSIGDDAFSDCSSLTSVSIPNSVTSIGRYAFQNCSSLTSVNIPTSVTTIEDSTFDGCINLRDITIHSSVTNIEGSAFKNCINLTSVAIPGSVTNIGRDAFRGCSGLRSFTIDSSNQNYSSEDGVLFNKDKTELILCVSGKSGKYSIPNYVSSIAEFAFLDCRDLTSVSIPNSVTTIPYSAFSGCSGLRSVTIPNSVTSIGLGAFAGCSGLTSLTIPNSVTTIGESAFFGCNNLIEEIDNIFYVGNWVVGLKNNIVCANIKAETIGISNSAFDGSEALTSVTIPNSVTNIGSRAFRNCNNLTSVTIPNSVTAIESQTFYDCTNLTSVTIPNSVIKIGSHAFSGCSNLTSVTIPNSVTTIESGAFDSCTNLTSVTIPNSVASIESSAFGRCIALTDITNYATTPLSIGYLSGVFYHVDPNNVTLHVKEGCGEAYSNAEGWKEFNIVEDAVEPEPDDSDIEESTDVSQYPIALYINDVENRAGDFNLDLNMKCTQEDITAFQCDIYLPEGVEWAYTTDKRGKVIYTLPTFNEERTDETYHTITPVAKNADGSYNLIVYSMDLVEILENDGPLMTLPLKISEDMEAGDYNIFIKRIVMTHLDKSTDRIDKMVSKLTIPSYELGDANGDGNIDVTDIVYVVSYIRGTEDAEFIKDAADVNTDGFVDVTDIVNIIDIIRSANDDGANSAKARSFVKKASAKTGSTLEVLPFSVAEGTKSATVKLDLINPGEEITAFQCDVVFPEGIAWASTVDKRGNKKYTQPVFDAEAERTDATYHTVDVGEKANGTMNIIVYSMEQEIFWGEEGTVLDMPFVFDENLEPGVYDIKLTNITVTNTDKVGTKPADYTFSILVGSPSPEIASVNLHGNITAQVIEDYNEALKNNESVSAIDLSEAANISSDVEFTTGNKNLLIYTAEGMSVKNSCNVVSGSVCDNLVITDAMPFSTLKSFTATNASYSRPMTNQWGTIVLPYEVASDANVEYYIPNSVENGTLKLTKIDVLPANTPALVAKVSGDGISANASNVAVSSALDSSVNGNVTMHGSYANNTMVTDANAYYIKNNQFWLNNGYFYIDAFRAYFTVEGAQAKSLRISPDGATMIDALVGDGEVGITEYYDASGARISNLRKGVNIVRLSNGETKKIIVE